MRTLSTIEAQLQANPGGFLRSVFAEERARVCLAGPRSGNVFQPGDAFPVSCGAFWTYTNAASTQPVAVELVPPTAAQPELHVRVLARAASLDSGVEAVYTLDGARRWVWASTGTLTLGSAGASDTVSVDGGMYAASGVLGAPGGGFSLEDGSVVATDGVFALAPSDPELSWYARTPLLGAAPPIASVRDVQRTTLSAGSLATTVDVLENAACPGSTAVNYTAAELATTKVASTTSHLCLRAGASLVNDAGQAVAVPAGTTAYLLLTDAPVAGKLTVYATTATIDLSATSTLLCTPRPSCASSAMDTDDHPGKLSFWETAPSTLLGTFYLPASGVVAADGDVYLGACSTNRNEYALGEVCAALSGTEPGMTLSRPLTVLAGTLRNPADVVVGSTIHVRSGGQLAAVGSARVVFPYWMQAPSGQSVVAAHLLGAGVKTTGSSVVSFPSIASPSERTAPLVINGSVTGVDLPVGLATASEVRYRFPPERATPPWFGGADATWRRTALLRLAGTDACGQRTCTSWTSDQVVSSIAPPSTQVTPAVVPDPPTAVAAVTSWAADAQQPQALVSYLPPAAAGSDPVTSYRATCSSPTGGVSRTADGTTSPLAVGGLDMRHTYSCVVQARSSAGFSPSSAPSASFDTYGPPDAPGSVTATGSWDGTTSNAEVTFSPPATTGGLAVSSYTVSCSSASGGTTRTQTGPSSPITVLGLTGAKTYTCAVTATNAAGTGVTSSASAPFDAASPPAAPTIDSVDATTSTITASWSPNGTGGSPITAYNLRWSTDGGATWSAAESQGIATSAEKTFPPGTQVRFQVNAQNAYGTSTWSTSPDQVTVPATPTRPASAPTCVDGAAQTVVSFSFTSPGDSDNGAPVTSYRLRWSANGGTTWTAGITVTSPHTVTGLQNGTTYRFQFAAVNAQGPSPWSASSAGCTPYSTPYAPDPPVCATGTNPGVLAVTWSAANGNGRTPTGYDLRYSTNSGSTWSAATAAGNALAYSLTGLANDTATVVQVRASNTAGVSSWSQASAPCYARPAVPAAPLSSGSCDNTGTTATGTCTVSWTAPAGTGYFEVSHTGKTPAGPLTVPNSTLSYSFQGKLYGPDDGSNLFVVQACNTRGCSPTQTVDLFSARSPSEPSVSLASQLAGVATWKFSADWTEGYEVEFYHGSAGNVVCRDASLQLAGCTDSSGTWQMRYLPAGVYTLYHDSTLVDGWQGTEQALSFNIYSPPLAGITSRIRVAGVNDHHCAGRVGGTPPPANACRFRDSSY